MPENLTDPSQSTAAFRAFVQNGGGQPERIWAMRAPRNKVLTLVAIVIGVAVVIALISLAVA